MDPHTGSGPTQQDRADFEYALARALTDPAVRAATAGDPHRAARLRALARKSADSVLDTAAAEYLTYRRLRDTAPLPAAGAAGPGERLSGWLGGLALIVPIVTGSAAAVFFLLGYVIDLSRPHAGLAGPLRTAAWSTVAVAVASALTGLLGLLVSAARQRAVPDADPRHGQELSAARTAWRGALLHRGLVPFLLAALHEADREVPS